MMSRILGITLIIVILRSYRAPADEKPEKPDKAELAKSVQAILKTNCYRCHGKEASNEGGFHFVLDQPRLLATKKVVPGNLKDSLLYKKMIAGDMPPAKDDDGKPVKQRPNREEIAIIKQWIEAGAPNFRK